MREVASVFPNDCLRATLDRVKDAPVADTTQPDYVRLITARRRGLEENILECKVPGCSAKFTLDSKNGKFKIISSYVLIGEQPCKDE